MSNRRELTIRRVKSFSCTGKPEILNLPPGNYFFELWGAQGGVHNDTSGRGGFVSGNVVFTNETKIHIYVGCKGILSEFNPIGGFNGGGSCVTGDFDIASGSGGGATDIRLGGSELDYRIMVAGGGGGDGGEDSDESGIMYYSGGYGGGYFGGNGSSWVDSDDFIYGIGGTQDKGGESASYDDNGTIFTSSPGLRGTGGNATGSSYSGGGGGGGFYGGSGAYEVGGGGGSGYYNPTIIQNATLLGGNELMPQPNEPEDIGHIGDGYVKITFDAPFNTLFINHSFNSSFFHFMLSILALFAFSQ